VHLTRYPNYSPNLNIPQLPATIKDRRTKEDRQGKLSCARPRARRGWLPCTWRASGGGRRRRPAVGCGYGDARKFRGMARGLRSRRRKLSARRRPRRRWARRVAAPSPFPRARQALRIFCSPLLPLNVGFAFSPLLISDGPCRCAFGHRPSAHFVGLRGPSLTYDSSSSPSGPSSSQRPRLRAHSRTPPSAPPPAPHLKP
jgi:hypothetical protein